MIIKRAIIGELKRLAKKYPVITITGPKQSGKTSLVKADFPGKNYFKV
ncbi:MAG: hypothetical protein HY920_08150 [Elusimicrobia bacterium]|nr:hypothetical protein [Elusimicrobiota bacterium]